MNFLKRKNINKKSTIILVVLFLLVLSLRLFIAFQTSDLSYDAYFTLRNVENIKSSGVPLYDDDLSYSGRDNVFSPLYYYLLALFSFVVPEVLVLKLLPNLFAASLIFVVYLFAKLLSKDEGASLIVAGASGIIPVFFANTINNASVFSLVIPLFFLSIYYFLRTVSVSSNLWKLIVCLLLLTLTHASSLILVLCLLLYVALLKIQGFKKSTKEPELLIFSLFLIVWVNLIIFKRAIEMHGSAVIYQNIPVKIILEVFQEITFIESLYWIGVIPLLFGVIAVYDSVFSSKKKSSSMLISIALVFFLLLWFKLINLEVGLMFLGVTTTILASNTISKSLKYTDNLKFKFVKPIMKIVLVFLIITSFIPAISNSYNNAMNVPSSNDKEVFLWLKNNTEKDAVILTLLSEGSAMSYYSDRKNVIDGNFFLIKNIDTRYEEINKIYSDKFLVPALTKLNYYSVDYILLSEKAERDKKMTELFYEDDECIKEIYLTKLNNITRNNPKVYSVNCVVSLQ